MEITTERLLLRPIVEGDAADLFEFARNSNVGPNAGWKPHCGLDETREVMGAIFLDKESVFGIVLRDSDKLIGTVGLIPDPRRSNPGVLMLGYSIGEDYWGNGYATEASKAVIHYGFNGLFLDMVSVYCYPFNGRSRRVIEKLGFKHEGCLRMAEVRYDGRVLDVECFSLKL